MPARGVRSNLDEVDTADGQKAVQHIFGDNTDQVADRLGGGGAGKGIVAKLLPLLAPIVLQWLASRILGSGQARGGNAAPEPGGRGGGGLGDILGQILGGGAGGSGGRGGGSGMPDLSDILGGGTK